MSQYCEAGDGSTAHATATYEEDRSKDKDGKSNQEDLENPEVQRGYREPMVKITVATICAGWRSREERIYNTYAGLFLFSGSAVQALARRTPCSKLKRLRPKTREDKEGSWKTEKPQTQKATVST